MKFRFCILLLLFTVLINPVWGQKKGSSSKKTVVTGTVLDKDKKPVREAEIFIDSTYSGYFTDEEGKYRVKVMPSASHIIAIIPDQGFGISEIAGRTVVDISFTGNQKDIPGFLTAEILKKSLISSKPKKVNTYTNIYQMIRDKVPGVLVSGKSIVVQQPNSFFGSTTPLFVVDGVRVPSIDDVNPVNVKSIELLTGSRAAIYGVEGSNGVIVITRFSGSDK